MRSGESAQSLLALIEQRALCTFFSMLAQASLHCCGLMVSSPGPCASSLARSAFHGFSIGFPRTKAQKCVNLVDLDKSFQTSFERDSYSNEYLLAKIGVDTAENGPLKLTVCQKLAKR